MVVKLLLPQHAADPEYASMLQDEARLTVGLRQANLVRVLELGRDGDQLFLAMELVDGPSLSDLLRRTRRQGGHAPLPAAMAVVRAVLQALRYLSGLDDEQGRSLEVVHRDVTPHNVLLSRSGEVKLGDFGIARHRLRAARTRSGVIKGTVQYMAPEQVTGSEMDRRTDLYGVGLILFELLTGQPYIDAEREVDLLRLAQDPTWRAPSSLRPGLDPALDRVLQRALACFPQQRFPDAGAFLDALGPFLPREEQDRELVARWVGELERATGEGEGGPEAESGAPQADIERLAAPGITRRTEARPAYSPPRSRRLWGGPVTVGVVLALALVLGGTWLLWDRGPGSREGGESRAAPIASLPPAAGSQADSASPDSGAPATAGRTAALDSREAAGPAMAVVTGRDRPLRPRRAPSPQVPAQVADSAEAREQADGKRDAMAVSAQQELVLMQRRLEAALASLRARGIRPQDMTATLLRRVEAWPELLRRGEPGRAQGELEQLLVTLGTLRVDRALVEAKLSRVDRLLGTLPANARRELDDRASQALQAFMDQRYGAANRHLEQILTLLEARGLR